MKLNDIQHGVLFLNSVAYGYDEPEIDVVITHDENTTNRIKLTQPSIDDYTGFTVTGLSLDAFKEHYSHYLKMFHIKDDIFYIPFSLILGIAKEYDNKFYNKIKPFHNKEHDDLVVNYHIELLKSRIEQLNNFKNSG